MKTLACVLLLLVISLVVRATIIEFESNGSWLLENGTWSYAESPILTNATINLTNSDRSAIYTASNNILNDDNNVEIGTYEHTFVQHNPYAELTGKIILPEISVYDSFIDNWLTDYNSTTKTQHNSQNFLSIEMFHDSYSLDSAYDNNPAYQKYQTNSLQISLCNTMLDTWTTPSNTGQYGQFLQIRNCLTSYIDTDLSYNDAFNFSELPALISQSTKLFHDTTLDIYDFTRDHDDFPSMSVHTTDTTITKEKFIMNFTYLNVVNKVPEPSTIFLFSMAILLILVNRPIR